MQAYNYTTKCIIRAGFQCHVQFLVQTAEGEAANEAAQSGKVALESPNVAEIEKRKARAARFGVPLNNPEDKKALRAQR